MVNNIILEKICLFCITYKILEKICVFCINVPIIHPKVVRVLCPSRLLLSTITILVLMSRKNGVYSAQGNFALAPPFTIASYMSLIIRPENSITDYYENGASKSRPSHTTLLRVKTITSNEQANVS